MNKRMTDVRIESANLKRVKRAVESAIKSDDWVTVFGPAGSGKTVLRDSMLDYWRMDNSVRVVYHPGLRHRGSRAGAFMSLLIQSMEMKPPRDLESRYAMLKLALVKAARERQRIVLCVDNAQNLTEGTIRDLKVLHEIGGLGRRRLFTIVFFAKDTGRLDELVKNSEEIGFRVKPVQLQPWTREEMLELVDALGFRWPSARHEREAAQRFFFAKTPAKPLGVVYVLDRVRSCPDGVLQEDLLRTALGRAWKDVLKERGVSYKEIQALHQNEHGRPISKATISQALQGLGSPETVSRIESLASKAMHEKPRNSRAS